MRSDPEGLRTLLLGSDPKQQLRASQALLVLGMQVIYAGVQHLEVVFGLLAWRDSWPLSLTSLTLGLCCYVVIRSGLNLRLKRDRALAVPQALYALGCLNWSYATNGAARGAILLLMLTVVLFGMFSLSQQQQKQLTGVTIASLGMVMVWKSLTDPARYDPRVEAVHFLFSAAVLLLGALLSVRIGRLRETLQAQKRELSQALARIQSLATRDELTGLLNRRAAMERLQLIRPDMIDAVEPARSELPPLAGRDPALARISVGLVDLDHFKCVNDTLGHGAGDEVLRRFAQAAQSVVRDSDVLARWGGEEFLLVMPGAGEEQALQVLARIRQRLLDTPMDDIHAELKVTFSAGVATCYSLSDLERAIERADGAMYRAKHGGRDRSCVAEELPRPAVQPQAWVPTPSQTAEA